MNKKLFTSLGMGMAAVASVAMLGWPGKSRKRRRVMRAIGRAAEDLSSAMKKI